MSRIRVLIVDESSLARDALRRLLGADDELDVVAVTASGRVALTKVEELTPAVVLLDVEPPERDGLKTLAALRSAHPGLPVIVFSRMCEQGSQTTVDALLLGANDYVTKPVSSEELQRCIRVELIAKIKSLGGGNASGADQARACRPFAGAPSVSVISPEISRPFRSASAAVEIVAIATSTGGPNALASVLSALPVSFAVPIVVVQHMSSGFTTSLADSLRRLTGRDVREVDSTRPLHEASVWIAPGGRHLAVTQRGATTHVTPNDAPPENECRPSADILLRSVAEVFGGRSLAVVLTGMGYDSLAGCRAVRQAGGSILVQDEASSVSWGMPGQVAAAGLADLILPLVDIPLEIVRRSTRR